MLLAGHLLFKPKVVQSKKLYNRNEEKLYTLKVATKNYDKTIKKIVCKIFNIKQCSCKKTKVYCEEGI